MVPFASDWLDAFVLIILFIYILVHLDFFHLLSPLPQDFEALLLEFLLAIFSDQGSVSVDNGQEGGLADPQLLHQVPDLLALEAEGQPGHGVEVVCVLLDVGVSTGQDCFKNLYFLIYLVVGPLKVLDELAAGCAGAGRKDYSYGLDAGGDSELGSQLVAALLL
jgi:hypothetical protein